MAEPMRPEDVPDELVDAIYAVIHRTCPRCVDADPPPDDLDDVMCPTCLDTRSIGPIVHDAEDWAAAIAAAVLPAHEAAVRAKVAEELRALKAKDLGIAPYDRCIATALGQDGAALDFMPPRTQVTVHLDPPPAPATGINQQLIAEAYQLGLHRGRGGA